MPSQGSQIAKPVPVEKTVRIVKIYPRPEFNVKPKKEDFRRQELTELSYLRSTIATQKDKIRRLKEEVEDQIKMLKAALEEDRQETVDQVKRRISRLQGALAYRGSDDFDER